MAGLKWLMLVAIFAAMLHQLVVVEANEYIDSEIDERAAEDAKMAEELVRQLSILSQADDNAQVKRRLEKRGWFRRAVRRVGHWIQRNPVKTATVVGALVGGKK